MRDYGEKLQESISDMTWWYYTKEEATSLGMLTFELSLKGEMWLQ